MNLSEKDRAVFMALSRVEQTSDEPDVGPTEIGLQIGKAYCNASSYVSPSLKRLVMNGLVERKSGGRYTTTSVGRDKARAWARGVSA